MFLAPELNEKWKDVLDHPNLPPLKDPTRRAVVGMMLENYQKEHRAEAQQLARMGALNLFETDTVPVNFMGTSSSTHGTGGIDTFDPVMVSLVRRAMPNLMPYDIGGVQPMTGPTGLVFAMRSRYTNQAGAETFYDEVNTIFSTVANSANVFGQKHVGSLPGTVSAVGNTAETNVYNTGVGMSTAQGEALGTTGNVAWAEMAFTIEKIEVKATTRALKAGYTLEIAQDMKAIHGLVMEDELSQILQTELLAEINRQFVRTINFNAKIGSQVDTATPGVFDLDVDANGRWSEEKFKGLVFHIDRECNAIAKETRRGKGNILICSSDVASALNAAGMLSYTPRLNTNLEVDDTGNTFVGMLLNRIKVYIDPYAAGGNYMTVGYKGPGAMDAGIFYCPYVPLQYVRAVEPGDFTPRIGYKTRYGIVANPYAQGLTQGLGAIVKDSNVYYRKSIISHIM